MHTHSHKLLGKYLARHYLSDQPDIHRYLFLFGCIQPDKNPLTYLRGSLRGIPFQGHNWQNLKQYLITKIARFKDRGISGALDYYRLGKLIHYLSDSFTHTHNREFQGTLKEHRLYELHLHGLLKRTLERKTPPVLSYQTITALIRNHHDLYSIPPHSAEKDIAAILDTCCSLMDAILNMQKAPSC